MWRLPQTKRRVYARNPLQAVVAQLRFHPILKVDERLADFQEQVRVTSRFRDYKSVEVQAVDIDLPLRPESSAKLMRQTQHQFLADDRAATLTLSQTSLGLEFRSHESRERLLDEATAAFHALEAVFAPIFPTRLGLRYVNAIDREAISDDLGREAPGRIELPRVAGKLRSQRSCCSRKSEFNPDPRLDGLRADRREEKDDRYLHHAFIQSRRVEPHAASNTEKISSAKPCT